MHCSISASGIPNPGGSPRTLSAERIDIFLTYPDEIQDVGLLARYQEMLSPDEIVRAGRFYREEDRRQFVVSRALVRTTLSQYFPVDPKDWLFTTNAYGRPEVANLLSGTKLLTFNVAHTRGLVVLVVGCERTVGIDTENIDSHTASLDIARRFFASGETTALLALPPEQQPERFLEYWTLKESYVKARGQGLAVPLDAFSFDVGNDGWVVLSVDWRLGDDAGGWRFWQWRPSPTHIVAVCSGPSAGRDAQLVAWKAVPLADAYEQPIRLLRRSTPSDATDPKAT